MNELLNALAQGIKESLIASGISCFVQDVPDLSSADKIVLYVTSQTSRLYAAITFDLPTAKVTTLVPMERPCQYSWRQTRQYLYDLNDPGSLDGIVNVLKAHCSTLMVKQSRIKLPRRGHRQRVARPNRGEPTAPA